MATRIRVEEVIEYLGLSGSRVLEELRAEGLFEEEWVEPDAAEELRVAAALIRELGVNAAGVEVVLQMRRRLLHLEGLMGSSLRRLLSELDER